MSCLWDVCIDTHQRHWTLGPVLGPGDGCFSACLKPNWGLSISCQASLSPSVRLKMHKGTVESFLCSLCLDWQLFIPLTCINLFPLLRYSKQKSLVVGNHLCKRFLQEKAVTHRCGSFFAAMSSKANPVSWALMTAEQRALFAVQVLCSLVITLPTLKHLLLQPLW